MLLRVFVILCFSSVVDIFGMGDTESVTIGGMISRLTETPAPPIEIEL